MSVEDKFCAAVKVINNLPKNGSYQPSHELMLKFYSYYKQATKGPNLTPKPSFWEVVKKAKWEAWAALGNMPRHKAMDAYVAELNKIVETMAYTDNVADFLSSLNSFYGSVPAEEVEMCIGPALEKVRSRNTSPLPDSRDGSPQRLGEPPEVGVRHETRNFCGTEDKENEEDEDDFLDTLEQAEPEIRPKHELNATTSRKLPQQIHSLSNGHVLNGKFNSSHSTDVRLNEALQKAVDSLSRDIALLAEKVKRVEDKRKTVSRRLFGNLSRPTIMFIIGWPILVHLSLLWLFRKKRRSAIPVSL